MTIVLFIVAWAASGLLASRIMWPVARRLIPVEFRGPIDAAIRAARGRHRENWGWDVFRALVGPFIIPMLLFGCACMVMALYSKKRAQARADVNVLSMLQDAVAAEVAQRVRTAFDALRQHLRPNGIDHLDLDAVLPLFVCAPETPIPARPAPRGQIKVPAVLLALEGKQASARHMLLPLAAFEFPDSTVVATYTCAPAFPTPAELAAPPPQYTIEFTVHLGVDGRVGYRERDIARKYTRLGAASEDDTEDFVAALKRLLRGEGFEEGEDE